MQIALKYSGIVKEYRSSSGSRRVALDGLDLNVERGEIFGFLGANGAGKTTAIHLAMGFVRPTSGRGEMLGNSFGDVKTRARVGFLGENVSLYSRTAESLVNFYGALNGIRYPVLRDRARSLFVSLGLEKRAGENVKRFSRGMLQRVGLAQALINDPELLILDEPTSALDPFSRIAVRELLLASRSAGKTVFLSSHLLSEVEQVCDRVAILRQGRIVRTGTLPELLSDQERFEIRASGVEGERIQGAKQVGREIVLCVERARQKQVVETIWAMGGEIQSITPVRQTLEDVFLTLAAPASNGEEAR